jgi:hypothetical protein
VPHLDYYTVVIALAPNAQKLFSAVPRKTVKLNWPLDDPSQTKGAPEEIKTAHETTFTFLQNNIKDLAEAILGSGEK